MQNANLKIIITYLFIFIGTVASAQPMGWATCATHDGGTYPLQGGEGGRSITLTSTHEDMSAMLADALDNYDLVVLDGAEGDFLLSRQVHLNGLKHKTLRGQNGATLRTLFQLSDTLRKVLDRADVKHLSSMAKEGETHTLSNGRRVKEEAEYRVRQLLITTLNDNNEEYRHAGCLQLSGCEDIILQDLTLQGPGAVDVSGADLLTIGSGSQHVWVDGCTFRDGMDGNFDINTRADFITVSRCTFCYTNLSYMHQNSNLIGSSDNAERNGEECLNVTFQLCRWGPGCHQRMPMVRFGKVHLLNCLYDCPGCLCTVNPRLRSEVLLEGCVWKGIDAKHLFAAHSATAYEWHDCLFDVPFTPISQGTVTLPYTYTALPADQVE